MRSPVLRVGATMTRTYRLLDVRGTSAQCVTDSHKNEDGGGLQERDCHRHFNLETRMGRNTTLAEADSAVKWLDQDAQEPVRGENAGGPPRGGGLNGAGGPAPCRPSTGY